MQVQAIQDTSAKPAPIPQKKAPAQPLPQQGSASKNNPNEPTPARILIDAFEDLRRRMATLEGRIVEGSSVKEVARLAQMIERVEGQLSEGAHRSGAMRKGAGKLLVVLLTVSAFGIGLFAAEYAPELRNSVEELTPSVAAFWQASLDLAGNLANK